MLKLFGHAVSLQTELLETWFYTWKKEEREQDIKEEEGIKVKKHKRYNNIKRMREKGGRGRISVCLESDLLQQRRRNMEQPSLLLQLSSSLHQLNMAVDYTGGGEEEEKERRGQEDRTEFRKRRKGRNGDGEDGRRRKDEEESWEAFSSRL